MHFRAGLNLDYTIADALRSCRGRSVHLQKHRLDRLAVLSGLAHVERDHIVASQAAEDLHVLAIVVAQSYLDQTQMALPHHRHIDLCDSDRVSLQTLICATGTLAAL